VTEVEGTIALESEPGKGTTVVIRIPVRTGKDLMQEQNVNGELVNRAKAV
jgi:hypothetical protein